MNWKRADLVQALLTLPPPSLVFQVPDGLQAYNLKLGGRAALNLTPLPLYGNLISDECLAQSEGNPVLMYDGPRGWIPIADHWHLHRADRDPTIIESLACHCAYHTCMQPYAALWRRAELALAPAAPQSTPSLLTLFNTHGFELLGPQMRLSLPGDFNTS